MALNANISPQLDFVQQQWIEYGKDAHLGNQKDILMGNHGAGADSSFKAMPAQQTLPSSAAICRTFVELHGGDYFFLPSITALGMIAMGLVDPR
jgi:hypothetical protein